MSGGSIGTDSLSFPLTDEGATMDGKSPSGDSMPSILSIERQQWRNLSSKLEEEPDEMGLKAMDELWKSPKLGVALALGGDASKRS